MPAEKTGEMVSFICILLATVLKSCVRCFLKDKFSPTGISLYSSKDPSLISLWVVGSCYIEKHALNEFSLCDGFWHTVITAMKLLVQFDSPTYITLILQVILKKISWSFLKNTITCHNSTSQSDCLLYSYHFQWRQRSHSNMNCRKIQ